MEDESGNANDRLTSLLAYLDQVDLSSRNKDTFKENVENKENVETKSTEKNKPLNRKAADFLQHKKVSNKSQLTEKPKRSLFGDSHSMKTKWVWEDWSYSDNERTQCGAVNLEDIKCGQERNYNLAAMQHELSKLNQEASRLDKLLDNTKFTHKAEVKDIRNSWFNRIAQQQKELDKFQESHSEFQSKLVKDCNLLQENKKLREEEVSKIKGAKHKICDVEEKKGNQMLINFQHKLDKGEKCRLGTLESKHIPEIKRNVGKDLEPEIMKIVNENKQKIESHRKAKEEEIQNFFAQKIEEHRTQLAHSAKVNKEKWQVKLDILLSEETQSVTATELQHSHKMQVIRNLHAKDIEDDRISFAEERSARVSQNNEELKVAKSDERSRLYKLCNNHDRKIQRLIKTHEQTVIKMREFLGDDDCWRTDRRKIKENESEILYETELNNVESRYRRDIDLAGKKLNSELIEYCRDVTKDYEKKVKEYRSNLDCEFKRSADNQLQVKESIEQLRSEKHSLQKIHSEKEKAVEGSKNKINDLRKKLDLEQNAMKDLDQAVRAKDEETQTQHNKKLQSIKSEIHALHAKVDILESDRKQRDEELEEQMRKLHADCKEEIRLAKDRIASIMESKELKLKMAKQKLSSIQDKNCDAIQNLDKLRRDSVLCKDSFGSN